MSVLLRRILKSRRLTPVYIADRSVSSSQDPMNLGLSMRFRPILLVMLLAFAALIVIFSLTPYWFVMVKHIEQHVNSNSELLFSEFKSEIQHSSILLNPVKSSATNLARFFNSTLDVTNVSFYQIKTQVAPVLFQAFETVPYLSEISYVGLGGLFFSYYTDHDQVFAMYSNSSLSSFRASNETVYYIQPANHDTGKLYGEAIRTLKPFINGSWFQKTVNSSFGYASLGSKWSNVRDVLFRSSARVSGKIVISLGFPVKNIIDFIAHTGRQEASLYLGTRDGRVLLEGIQNTHMQFSADDMVSIELESPNGNGNSIHEGIVSCKDEDASSVFNIGDTQYLFDCAPINIMGVESVYVLAVPQNGLTSLVRKSRKHGSQLLSAVMGMIIISIICFVFTIFRLSRRETHLCASLIKQIEATEQAERKSMNKSLAYASASHDVRASLAGLIGLIEMSLEEVVAGSELESNLRQMDSCTKDLLGLLNSILDTSKIEAGKMQLDEEEFDLSQLLEDVVDLYHPVAIKKGVDIVLDSCNGSVLTFSQVKGDRGKLKQILCNLLSNSVKFTDEGHIIVRAWAQKPSFQNSVIAASKRVNFIKHLLDLFHKKREVDKQEVMNPTQKKENCMEFVFEVDDTGKGIPKEKRKFVFENYVQVKETAFGLGGTGLGLGIVQSLVRLMHGDIGFVDKDNHEKGTCLRFNVLLIAHDNKWEDNDSRSDRNQVVGRNIHSPTSSSGMCSPSPKLTIRTSSPKSEASRVVLLIQNEARLKTSQKLMERLGIEVKIVKQWEHLFHILRKIKQKGCQYDRSQSSSDLSSSSISQNSFSRSKDVPLSCMDGTDQLPSLFKKTQTGAISGFVLLIIDANAGPISELCKIVSDFRRSLLNPCQVVWLDKPLNRCFNFKELDEDMFDPNDLVIYKPFHGTRLFEVIKLLPEFGGTWQKYSSSRTTEGTSTKNKFGKNHRDSEKPIKHSPERQRTEKEILWKEMHSEMAIQGSSSKKGEIQECIDFSSEKPLIGKKVLIVEDDRVLSTVSSRHWLCLGATVELCENGEEAVKLVKKALTHASPNLPYDYILMDCVMPVMNGFEATKRIRKMEKSLGVHIPIIAFTAHALGSKEASEIMEAGMDFHLCKPIEKQHLLEAIKYIHSKE